LNRHISWTLEKKIFMQELISRITNQVGISEEQSKKVLNVISDFIKEKYPAVGGMMDNLLSQQGSKSNEDEGSGGLNLGGFKF
jgi:hypothetical protein